MFALLQQEVVIIIVLGLLIIGGTQLPKLVRALTEQHAEHETGDRHRGV